MSLNGVYKITNVSNKLILNPGVFKHYAFALQIFTDSLKKGKRGEYKHFHNIIRFLCLLILIVCRVYRQSNKNVYSVAPLATTLVHEL